MKSARIQELIRVLTDLADGAERSADFAGPMVYTHERKRRAQIMLGPTTVPELAEQLRADIADADASIAEWGEGGPVWAINVDRHARLRSLQAELEADLHDGQLVLDHFEESLQEMRRRFAELIAYGSWMKPRHAR